MKRNFEHKKCNTTLSEVLPIDAVKTKCWKCGKRFLQPEEYVKMTMDEEKR